MELIKLLLITTLLTLIPGQVLRIPQSSTFGAITLTDISVAVLDFCFIFYSLGIKKSIKFPPKIFIPFTLFCLWASVTIVWALTMFPVFDVLISSLFLVRFVLYFFLAIIAFNLIPKDKINGWRNLIVLIGVIYALIGFAQFILIPDLTFLAPFGWDPHQRRIVSTVIDPNYSGYIFVLVFSLAISAAVFNKKHKYFLLSAVISFIAIVLTFSRSSYLALITAITTIGVIKSKKLLLAAAAILIAIFILIPQVRDRVIGALTVDETSRARIESWQNALLVIRDNPLLGVGFNDYRFAQAKYNFFSIENPLGGHSGGGVDSSLLLVTATTGIPGILLFVFMLASLAKSISKKASSNPLHLATLACFMALLVHSIFVNSLFFPQIMLLIFFLIGLSIKNDS